MYCTQQGVKSNKNNKTKCIYDLKITVNGFFLNGLFYQGHHKYKDKTKVILVGQQINPITVKFGAFTSL